MYKFKKLFTFAILIAAMTCTIQAQPGKNKGKSFKGTTASADTRAKDFTDTLKNVLKLTTTQYEQVFAINKDFYTKRDAIRAAAKADTVVANKPQYKQQTKTLQKTRKASIEALLTAEQKAAWQAWRDQKELNKKVKLKNGTKPADNDDDGM